MGFFMGCNAFISRQPLSSPSREGRDSPSASSVSVLTWDLNWDSIRLSCKGCVDFKWLDGWTGHFGWIEQFKVDNTPRTQSVSVCVAAWCKYLCKHPQPLIDLLQRLSGAFVDSSNCLWVLMTMGEICQDPPNVVFVSFFELSRAQYAW